MSAGSVRPGGVTLRSVRGLYGSACGSVAAFREGVAEGRGQLRCRSSAAPLPQLRCSAAAASLLVVVALWHCCGGAVGAVRFPANRLTTPLAG